MLLNKIIGYLRLKPFDAATDGSRIDERYRHAAWTAAANVASAGLGFLTFAITVPLTISYLGQERFGLWMTVASLAGTLSLMDLGIGNALVSRVAALSQSANSNELAPAATHALAVLTVVGVLAALLMGSAALLLPMEEWIRGSDAALDHELRNTMLTFAAIYAASVPINGAAKILQGLQLGWKVHIVRSVASVVSVLAVYILSGIQAPIPALLCATYGVQILFASALFFPLVRMRLLKNFSLSMLKDRAQTRNLVLTGSLFLALQIAGLIGWGSDALFAALVLGTSQVAQLVIIQRLFQLVTLPLGIVNGPLWSAYAAASAKNDRRFVRATLTRSMLFSAAYAVIAVAVISLGADFVLKFWLHDSIAIGQPLLLLYGFWILFEGVGGAFAMFLNGVGVVKLQVWLAAVFCLLAIPLKLFLPGEFGLEGLIISNIAAYLAAFAVPYTLLFRSQLLRFLR